jgi:hypothetical protein
MTVPEGGAWAACRIRAMNAHHPGPITFPCDLNWPASVSSIVARPSSNVIRFSDQRDMRTPVQSVEREKYWPSRVRSH